MKMTTSIVNHKNELLQMIEAIKKIYGTQQMIYVQDEQSKMIFRGKIGEILSENVK